MDSVSRFLLAALVICSLPAVVAAQSGDGRSRVDTGMPWNVHYERSASNAPTWSLFNFENVPLEMGGWASGGFTANAHGNRSGNGNAPLPINNVSDTPVLNQLWLYAAKPLDMASNRFDWGFRVDYLFGVDAPDTQASGDQGWDFGWNRSRDYGSAIPQLYLEFGWDKAILRVGYKFGLQGYEASQAIDNFFYSHNYAFGYGVPGTFAGAAVTYSLTDRLEVVGGWTTGWDSWWSNYLGASSFMGGFTWSINDATSLTYHVTAGDYGDGTAKNAAASNNGTIYAHAIVLTHQLNDDVDWAVENSFGSNTGLGANNNHWYSMTGYLFVELSDSWVAGTRLEWFRDEDGKRVNVNGARSGSYYEATLGLNWYPCSNLALRPEIRFDWFDGVGRPFDRIPGSMNGTASHQTTGGLDLVFVF